MATNNHGACGGGASVSELAALIELYHVKDEEGTSAVMSCRICLLKPVEISACKNSHYVNLATNVIHLV